MGYANAIEATWRPAYGMNVPRASPRYTPTPPAAPGHDTASASRMTSAADQQGLAALLARMADGDAQRFVTVRRDDGVWQSLAPDISMKILDSDRSMQAYLLRLAPGACLPGHPHPDDEMCYVLEGEATLGDITVGPGDYHLARAGSAHGDVTTRAGCLLLIRSGSGVATHRRALHGA